MAWGEMESVRKENGDRKGMDEKLNEEEQNGEEMETVRK